MQLDLSKTDFSQLIIRFEDFIENECELKLSLMSARPKLHLGIIKQFTDEAYKFPLMVLDEDAALILGRLLVEFGTKGEITLANLGDNQNE